MRWFENYLKAQKQFISFEHNSNKKATEHAVFLKHPF